MSALRGEWVIAFGGKQKDSVQKKDSCNFRREDKSAWKDNTIVLSCSKIADSENDGRRPSKPLCVDWHLPYVKTTNLNRDGNSAISVCLGTLRLSKKSKKRGEKGTVAALMKSKH